MDLSISYHPITQEQMQTWYFDAFEDIAVANSLKVKIPQEQLRHHKLGELEAFYQEKYKEIITRSRALEYDNFNKWHAYFIAIAQGFFEKFYFVHGSALSAIIDDEFHATYVTPWEEVAPSEYLEDMRVSQKLDGAYSAGVYLSPEQVKCLLHDYKTDKEIKEILDEQFPKRKMDVLLAALTYASDNNQGLLEAAKVIEQGGEIFEEPTCYSNLFNCDVISAAVYTSELAEHYDEIYKGTGE
jgi:hypothetical protein